MAENMSSRLIFNTAHPSTCAEVKHLIATGIVSQVESLRDSETSG